MKRILYIVLLALALAIPVKRLDIAKLEPIEAVAVMVEDGLVCLRTDTESEGKGETVALALRALKENAKGMVYLDTARFLLVAENAYEEAKALMQYLRRNVQVAPYGGTGVKEEAQYLETHDFAAKPG